MDEMRRAVSTQLQVYRDSNEMRRTSFDKRRQYNSTLLLDFNNGLITNSTMQPIVIITSPTPDQESGNVPAYRPLTSQKVQHCFSELFRFVEVDEVSATGNH